MIDRLSSADLAKMIDISAVQAYHTAADVVELARIAVERKFVAAHVLPNFVSLLRDNLGDSGTMTGAPVGFPSGGSTRHIKVAEARELRDAGVQEMDLMINLGRLRSGDFAYVLDEIEAVVESVTPIPVKVILEVHYLSDEQIKRSCEMCIQAGAEFVKTATGWAPSGATLERIELITGFVKDAIKVKASGGIRDYETVEKMCRLGVKRFGINTAAAISILENCDK
jgi:deoxyribose-phosphate aldolase